MTNNSEEYSFTDFISQGSGCQSELFAIYKSSIGLINDLKNRSRKYMTILSDIEGETLGVQETDNSLKSNLEKLTESINSFNEVIVDKCDSFTKIFNRMGTAYEEATLLYEAKEGQLSKLIEVRKQIIFLKALIKKYKYKITSLQLMNNALLSLSNDLEYAKAAYKSNLIKLNMAMTSAIEEADLLIEKIDYISSTK